MATKASASTKTMTAGTGREIAINKTRGLAFARSGEAEEWQPIDLASVTDLAMRKGEDHAKIGEHWFTVYKMEAGKR